MDDELELDAELAEFEAMANGTWEPKEPETIEEEDPIEDVEDSEE